MIPDETRLRRLWDAIPGGYCKGLCVKSCKSPVDTSPLERDILTRHGVEIPAPENPEAWERAFHDPEYVCPAYDTEAGKCGAYEDRPTGCRVWGVSRMTPCPYGCTPEGGHWPPARACVVLVKAEALGGGKDPATARGQIAWLGTDEGRAYTEGLAGPASEAAARVAR